MSAALPDQNRSVSVFGSQLISIKFYDSNLIEQSISNTSEPFYFNIPRNNSELPIFKILPISTRNSNLLIVNGFIISNSNVSIHYHIKPDNSSLAYFVALKFGSYPVLNKTSQIADIWKIFCPKGTLNYFILLYFLKILKNFLRPKKRRFNFLCIICKHE
jgi:hypothetical protein